MYLNKKIFISTQKDFTSTPRGVSLQGKQGFTLIELLVVISIIGLLGAIVVAGLSDSRIRARIAAGQSTMASVKTSLIGNCMGVNLAINVPAETRTPTTLMCTGAAAYPPLPSGWIYCNATSSGEPQSATGCGNDTSSGGTTGSSFSIVAENHSDGRRITCTQNSCTIINDTN